MNKINVLTIAKQKYLNYMSNIKTIILYSIVVILFLGSNIGYYFYYINIDIYYSITMTIEYYFIIFNSLLIFILSVFQSVSLYRSDIDDKKIALEQRYGAKAKQIYLGRLMASILFFIQIIIFIIFINIIFAVILNINNVNIYKMFISSIGWYAILFIIFTLISIFFVVFFNELLTLLFSLILFSLILFSSGLSISIIDIRNKDFSWKFSDINNDIFEYIRINEIKTSLEESSSEFSRYQEFYDIITLDYPISSYQDKDVWLAFGTTYWSEETYENLENANFLYLIDFYEYFTIYFDNKETEYTSKDINYFSSPHQNEQTGKILKNLDIDNNYKNIINIFYKYNTTWEIIDYNYISDNKIDNVTIDNFIDSQVGTNPSEKFIFFKMFNKTLSDIYIETNLIPDLDEYNDLLKIYKLNFWINPVVQFGAMFNGINYQQELVQNRLNSMSDTAQSSNSFDIKNESNKIVYKRTVFVEVLYIEYTIISMLVIYLCYFRFKANILK